ncbi:hypothetical protein [Candidatus Enterococcus ferrettii]|uniref:PTS EIIB type-3 domain-containing protein n=1 Tax=Candidatus Enterococcus ferrettii TaxID=2815324 RepID=A0ABV0ETC8_9ENTE|nr:hypothetical protein [Enterococcus sp. 665A]MBO1343004.1 hypothetical protein [Enterococcus sp. 665A]
MQKVVWIYSINVYDTSAPFGFGTPGVRAWHGNKFQSEMKAALQPEIELEFISYNPASNDIPDADLVLFNSLDAKRLSDEITDKGLAIPFQYLYMGKVQEIKEYLMPFLKSAST